MPLIIDGGRVPPRWAERKKGHAHGVMENSATRAECVRIAFVNNMPDSALEDTETQFFELLDAASAAVPVSVRLHALAGVPRGERGQDHVSKFYFDTNDLLNRRLDALIMTGTEPKQPDLQSEPYWRAMSAALEWAENNTSSTILSCLAAHAGVLHSDGIHRQPLPDKQFGVFDFTAPASHHLTAGSTGGVCFPHSRWNEVRASELIECGYQVLTQSAEGGVDSFVKKKKQSLFVHFQGHPEYSTRTLLKEYRRDIKRFLRRERETYPSMPKGYFDAASTGLLAEFRDAVLHDRREELMNKFPESAVESSLQNRWQASSINIYRNWLQYVVGKKSAVPAFASVAAVYHETARKRSANS